MCVCVCVGGGLDEPAPVLLEVGATYPAAITAPLIWGSRGYPPGKKLLCWRSVFKPVLGQNVRFQT